MVKVYMTNSKSVILITFNFTKKKSVKDKEVKYEYYNYVSMDSENIRLGNELFNTFGTTSTSLNDRSNRMILANFRAKFDKVT